ncbi:MAG: OmpA family protein [candidate division WOR-3 bacterium]|nr:MAG: OmpA family protein [candidate division WOR-3 bacterium]
MKTALIIFIVLAVILAGTTYYFYTQNEKTKMELQAKIADLSVEKEQEIDRLADTYEKLVTDMQAEIEQGQVTITQLADRLSVSMVDKILFPSGKAEIMPEGIEVLERVGNILKNVEDKIIRVEGHTDNVQIHPKLQEQFPTNWELSTTRATNVVRFLQEEVEIDPGKLEAIGMSEYHPVAGNDTQEGRSQNRRIEIILVPLVPEG